MKLYQYAVIKDEKLDNESNIVEAASLVVEPATILARNDAQATLLAGRAIPDAELENLDRLTVVVRPF